jgi:hypothetical protein
MPNPTAEVDPALAATRQRWFTYVLIITVAAGNGLAGIVSGPLMHSPDQRRPGPHPPQVPIYSANDRSRWCTVWSLVDRGTYQIDEIIQEPGWDTIDKGRFNEHFYSSKPPFVATIAAAVYYILKEIGGLDLLQDPHLVAPLVLLAINWLPWIVSLVLIAEMCERSARSEGGRIFVLIAAAGGTFLTTFLPTLNNHSVAANAVVFALFPFLSVVNDNRREGWLFAAAGFWGAVTACCELPAALFGLALFGLLWRQSWRQTMKWFLPAAAVPLAFFFYTNWLCTGGLMPFYANFGSPDDTFYRYVYNGIPSYWSNPSALDRGEASLSVYLFHCTVGHHGILSLSPIYFLTLAGWSRLGKSNPLRLVGWMSLILTVWVLDFYLLQTQSYNYGGFTSGLRWAFWLTPLWLLAMVPALDEWSHRPGFQFVAIVLLLVSVFSAACPRDNPWQHPWLMKILER